MTIPASPDSAPLPLVVFAAGAERGALALDAVLRALPMVAVAPLAEAPPAVRGVVNLQGAVVPVFDVRRRLGAAPAVHGLGGHLLVARTTRRTVALAVDAVLGVREVAPEAVTSAAVAAPGSGLVAGIAALADGLLFIHDLERFLSPEDERRLDAALAEVGA